MLNVDQFQREYRHATNALGGKNAGPRRMVWKQHHVFIYRCNSC
jgi:hypothetical protein